MLNKLINFIKGKTNKCNHEYAEFRAVSKYENLNGYRVYVRCEKCGHIKNSYFRYE
ncbi:MAG: hypothetical protein RR657_02595 [Peptostreptococcaceae bacterium]